MISFRVGLPARAGGVVLIPIERVHTRGESLDAGCWLLAELEPFAVVVCDGSGARALDAEGNAWNLDELVLRFPELDALIDRLAPRQP